MTARHYPGVVTEKRELPAGRGKKVIIATVTTSPPRDKKSKYDKLDYLNAISLGKNPLLSYTYNLATDQASLDYFNQKMKDKKYEVLDRHDEEELLAFLYVTRIRQRQKRLEKREHSRDSRDRDRERQKREKQHPDSCHAVLSSQTTCKPKECEWEIPRTLWIPEDLRERMERIRRKFEAAERKRAARHPRIINYKK